MRVPDVPGGWRSVTALVALAALMPAQEPQPQEAEAPRPRAGVGVNHVSAYGMGLSTSGLEDAGATPWSGRLAAGGASFNVGMRTIGRMATAEFDYGLAYDWNNQQPLFNGFDQAINLAVRTREGNRTQFSLTGTAEQRRLSSQLFEPLGVVTLVRSRSFTDVSDSLAEIRAAGTPVVSALDLWLFGSRLRRATGRTMVTFAQSRRLSWYGIAAAERTLPALESGRDLPERTMLTGVSMGNAGGGFQLAVSRRTSIGGSAGYGRTFAGPVRAWSSDAGLNFSRFLSERCFVYAAGGYGVMRELTEARPPAAHSYQASGGLGVSHGAHTVTVLALRGLSSRYGASGLRSAAGEAAWNWRPRLQPWGLAASVNYQRLTGDRQQQLQGWTGQFGVTRNLGRQAGIAVQMVYAGLDGRLGGPLLSAGVRALRITLFWDPLDLWY